MFSSFCYGVPGTAPKEIGNVISGTPRKYSPMELALVVQTIIDETRSSKGVFGNCTQRFLSMRRVLGHNASAESKRWAMARVRQIKSNDPWEVELRTVRGTCSIVEKWK